MSWTDSPIAAQNQRAVVSQQQLARKSKAGCSFRHALEVVVAGDQRVAGIDLIIVSIQQG